MKNTQFMLPNPNDVFPPRPFWAPLEKKNEDLGGLP
jgi:hypothetical protein